MGRLLNHRHRTNEHVAYRRALNSFKGQHVEKRFTKRLSLGPASPRQTRGSPGLVTGFQLSPFPATSQMPILEQQTAYLLLMLQASLIAITAFQGHLESASLRPGYGETGLRDMVFVEKDAQRLLWKKTGPLGKGAMRAAG